LERQDRDFGVTVSRRDRDVRKNVSRPRLQPCYTFQLSSNISSDLNFFTIIIPDAEQNIFVVAGVYLLYDIYSLFCHHCNSSGGTSSVSVSEHCSNCCKNNYIRNSCLSELTLKVSSKKSIFER